MESFKYLGMYLDRNLSFNVHIDKMIDKVLKRLGLLDKVRWLFGLDTPKTL